VNVKSIDKSKEQNSHKTNVSSSEINNEKQKLPKKFVQILNRPLTTSKQSNAKNNFLDEQ